MTETDRQPLPEEFGPLVRHFMQKRQVRMQDLAKHLNISPSSLSRILAGDSMPSGSMVRKIAKYFELSNSEVIKLLKSADSALEKPIPLQPVMASSHMHIETVKAHSGLEDPIINLQTTVDTLQKIVAETQTKDNSKMMASIREELAILTSNITKLETEAKELTAPVRFPKPSAMEITLVPTTMLERLEEYRHESNKWDTVFGIFIGAVLGLLSNLVTGGKMAFETWALTAILVGLSGFTWWSGYRYKERARLIKEEINAENKE